MAYRFLLAVLWVLSSVNGLSNVLPRGKKTVFDYSAVIKAGAISIDEYGSQFTLFAQLHILSPKEGYLKAQLRNITFKLFNGKIKYAHEHQLNQLPISSETNDLEKPIEILYNKDGQVKSIVTEKTESVFARNMHKALVALLQLKSDSTTFESKHKHTFVTKENTIYGNSRIAYTVLPKKEHVIVQKVNDMQSTKHLYRSIITNVQPELCEADFEEPLSHDSQQLYTFNREGSEYVLRRIVSSGGFYFYPFLARYNVLYIHADVTLNWLSEKPIELSFEVKNKYWEVELSYSMLDPNVPHQISEVLARFHTHDVKTSLAILEEMMEEMRSYLNLNHLETSTISIKKSQVVKRMVELLIHFDYASLESIYSGLRNKAYDNLKIFHQLIPLLGTDASIRLTTKIVSETKVDNQVAVGMLQSMVTYVRAPSETLLKDIEYILYWSDDFDVNVRRAAILNFGILVHKTFEHQKKFAATCRDCDSNGHTNFQQRGIHDLSHVPEYIRQFLNTSTIYDKYVEYFSAKLTAATDIATQMLYIEALFNIKIESALRSVLPYVTGEACMDQDLREMALWVVSHTIFGNPEKVIEVYWPIFTDVSEPTELRIVAYFIIMKSRPSMPRMLNIYWKMQHESNSELYMFHYTYLKALSRTTDPCFQTLRRHSEQLLKYTRKPNQQAFSFFYQNDFFVHDFGLGGEMSGLYLAVPRTRMFLLDINVQIANVKINYYSLFLKIGGLDKTVRDKIQLNLRKDEWTFNYEELWAFVKNITEVKDVEVIMCITKNLYIIQSFNVNKENIREIHHIFNTIFNEDFSEDLQKFEMYYDFAAAMSIPTEIGMPAYMEAKIPTIIEKRGGISKSINDGINHYTLKSRYFLSRNIHWGLSFYNPVLHLYQGIDSVHSLDLVVPLNLDFMYFTNPFIIKLIWGMDEDVTKNVVGFRSYSVTLTYVNDEGSIGKDILQQSCKQCENWYRITKGEFYRHNQTLFYYKSCNAGFASKGILFDSEDYDNNKKSDSSVKNFDISMSENSRILLQYLVKYLQNLNLGMLRPTLETKGFLITAYPSSDHNANQAFLTLRLRNSIDNQKGEFLPAMKLTLSITYTLKNITRPISIWHVHVVSGLNAGHTLENTKVDVTHIDLEERYFKVCIDSDKTWTKEGVVGHTNVTMGLTSDGTCKNETTVDISMVGKMADNQNTPYHQYAVCDPDSHRFGPDFHSVRCAATHTSIRKYHYDIKYQNIPPECEKMVKTLSTIFWKANMDYYTHTSNIESIPVDKNNLKFFVEYPITGNEAHLEIVTSEGTHRFDRLLADDLSFWSSHPDNTHYSKLYMWMYHMGLVNTCTLFSDRIQFGFNEERELKTFQILPEWTMVVGDSETDAKNGVFVKKANVSNLMDLKVTHNEQSVEIYTDDISKSDYRILVNGKEVSQLSDNYNDDWFNFIIRPHMHSTIITHIKFKMHLEFKGSILILQVPNVDGIEYYGPCIVKE